MTLLPHNFSKRKLVEKSWSPILKEKIFPKIFPRFFPRFFSRNVTLGKWRKLSSWYMSENQNWISRTFSRTFFASESGSSMLIKEGCVNFRARGRGIIWICIPLNIPSQYCWQWDASPFPPLFRACKTAPVPKHVMRVVNSQGSSWLGE